VAVYAGAMRQFAGAYGGGTATGTGGGNNYIVETGVLTDEFQATYDVSFFGLDSRTADTGTGSYGTYDALQTARTQAHLATSALAKFGKASPPSDVAESYMMEAYTELLLAEYICSGIPLSTVNFGGGITYSAGLTTTQVLNAALAHFDTASTYASTASIETAIAIGKGRTWLDLDAYDSAAAAVINVAPNAAYLVQYGTENGFQNGVWSGFGAGASSSTITVSNIEGENGLNFVSAQDPRVPTTNLAPATGYAAYSSASSPIVLAGGIEGQLIQAEAALSHGTPSWLDILNGLRTDGTFTTAPDPSNPSATDTTYNAGSGGVAGLPPLADPGTPDAQVDLLFRERAFWLYATGHREGDLRRLVRQYQRPEQTIYPIGPYIPAVSGFGSGALPTAYGSQVVGLPDVQEQQENGLYHGCFNLGA
jgi:starch-binding outer membrane protein, SusD/RagB family